MPNVDNLDISCSESSDLLPDCYANHVPQQLGRVRINNWVRVHRSIVRGEHTHLLGGGRLHVDLQSVMRAQSLSNSQLVLVGARYIRDRYI